MRYLALALLFACDGDRSATVGPTAGDDDDDVIEPPDTDDPTEACAAIVEVGESEGVQVLERRLEVTLDGPEAVWATCTSPDDPDELHLVEGTTDAASHTLVLRGLLAETDYTCTVHAACGGPAVDVPFATGTPAGVPRVEAWRDPSLPFSGAYTLFNSQSGCNGQTVWVMIADPEGRLRWMYPAGEDMVVDVDMTLIGPDTLHLGGGWGIFDESQPNRGVFRTMDLSGNVLLEKELPEFGLGWNHHSEPLADGSYLDITGSLDTDGSRDWNGVGVQVWHPSKGLVWTWDSQPLVDQGLLDAGGLFDPLPYHANAAAWLTDAQGDAVWLSIYGEEQLWRIDRATGERTHVFGHDGDFALVDAAGAPLPEAEFPWVVHGPDYAGDHVLVYDNGVNRPGGSYSRVAEYELDLQGGVATLLWSWTEPDWSYPIVGDADYLENGNVLVTKGFNPCFQPFEQNVSELVELVPPDEVAWRLTWPSRDWSVYRSQRYDGCDVFANARYCPAVADRIAELGG